MAKVIVKVIVALLVLAYGAMFLSWNMTPQEVTGFYWAGTRYSQMVPLGLLVFIGLIAGAVIMAVAAWAAWAAQKATADKHAATIRKAKVKLQAQLDEIHDLREQLAQAQGELEGLQSGDGTWGQVSAGDLEPVAAGAAASAPAEPEVDDPDVI